MPISNSASGLLSTLLPLLAANLCMVAAFVVLRPRFESIYRPRNLSFDKNSKHTGLRWLRDFWRLPDAHVVKDQSLDAYLILRFLKVLIRLAAWGCVITWPILLPLNVTGQGDAIQLDQLSISNVADPRRFYAHSLLACAFYGYVIYTISTETSFYTELLQIYVLSPKVQKSIVPRTVLFTDVPLDEMSLLGQLLRDVQYTWQTSNVTELADTIRKAEKTVAWLERAIITVSRMATARVQDFESGKETTQAALAYAETQRPLYRPSVFSKRVDGIRFHITQLETYAARIADLQKAHSEQGLLQTTAVFIAFKTVEAAETAFRRLMHHRAGSMQARAIGVEPSEVIWWSLGLAGWQRDAMYLTTLMVACVVFIFWSPVAGSVGLLSNVNYLEGYAMFSWVRSVPQPIIGLLTGLLPTLILTLLLTAIPIFFRVLARASGAVSLGEAEVIVQRWYFMFQLIQVFLLVTIGSSATAVLPQIVDEPTATTRILAASLPKSSNFYINLFVLYGTVVSASTLLNYSALIGYLVLGMFDDTPRKKYLRAITPAWVSWGTIYPKFSILGVIFLAYAIISPLILGFAAIAMALIYAAFRYNVFLTLDCGILAMRGRYYPLALQHLAAGVYIGQLCLVGIFAIRIGDELSSIGPTTITLLSLLATVLMHLRIHSKLEPLINHLPMDRLHDQENWPWTKRPGLAELTNNLGGGPQPTEALQDFYLHPSITWSPPALWLVQGEIADSFAADAVPLEIVSDGAWFENMKLHILEVGPFWNGSRLSYISVPKPC